MASEAQATERLHQEPRELPSVDFMLSVGEKKPEHSGAVFIGRVKLSDGEYFAELHTWGEPEKNYGTTELRISRGVNGEQWNINHYTDGMLLYLTRGHLPTLLAPDAAVEVDRAMSNPVAWLMYKERNTAPGPITDANIDEAKSHVDSEYFSSVGSAVDILAGLVSAIKQSSQVVSPVGQ
jgi:hypothetical protein